MYACLMRRARWPWLEFALMLVAGCGRGAAPGGPSPATAVHTKPSAGLAGGEKVTLIREAGDFALIRAGSGQESYVPLSLLKHRNTAEAAHDTSFTHTVVRDAPTFADPPPQKPALEPRSLADIDIEQRTLNGLYLSENTSKEVTAPRNVARFLIDEQTGERCWHAYECTHPNCPGPKTGGREHFIFIHTEHDTQEAIHCPACLKVRNLTKETKEEWQQWGRYVRPYELPETLRRRAELDNERRESIEALRRGAAPAAP